MPEVKSVIVQTGYADPERGDPGAVEVGHYIVNGRDLLITDESGRPMSKPRRLEPGEDPHVIAGRLTRERWLKTNDASNFNRPLKYRSLGH